MTSTEQIVLASDKLAHLQQYLCKKGVKNEIVDKDTISMDLKTTYNDHGLGDDFSRNVFIRHITEDVYALHIAAKARAVDPNLGKLYTKSVTMALMEGVLGIFASKNPYMDTTQYFPIEWSLMPVDAETKAVFVSGMTSVNTTLESMEYLLDMLYMFPDVELVQRQSIEELNALAAEGNNTTICSDPVVPTKMIQ